MNKFKDNKSDHFEILRKISKKPGTSQRKLSGELGFSLGKLNYCLRELQKKRLIKIRNFKKNKKKINYFYILTPKGISFKTMLTINFMKRKMKEYDELKSEMDSSEFKISKEVKSKDNNLKLKKINYDLL
jgi:EPS-associated MarR family transcriptional regulator|tara:strand:+ start:436 stop:825 length:390 start_codon:yes stop_codon:yes gene_type:complete